MIDDLDTLRPPDEGELLLDLLGLPEIETEPLSRAERVALVFDARCQAALEGKRMTQSEFLKSPEFAEIKNDTRRCLGNLFYDLATDWLKVNNNLFI